MSNAQGILDVISNMVNQITNDMANVIRGTSANDSFSLPPSPSSMTYDGLEGEDTVVFSGKLNQFSFSKKANLHFAVKPNASSGIQVDLLNTELAKFNDYQIDLRGLDGVIKKDFQLIRATLGGSFLQDKNIVNAGASLLASGLSLFDINNLLVTQNLMSLVVAGGKTDNASVFNHAFSNVMGRTANSAESGYWMPLIQQNGQAWFLTEMANQTSNTPEAELIGFQRRDFTLTL
jgi:hypothetical protein